MHRKGTSFFCRPVITEILNIFQKANLRNIRTALPMRTIVVDVQASLFVWLVRERKARRLASILMRGCTVKVFYFSAVL